MKKNYFLLFSVGIFLLLQLSQTSCTNDKLPEQTTNPVCDTLVVTYDNQVKPIIDASCAFAGCHFDGAVIGDFTDYAKMTPILNDIKFERRVLEIKDMPEEPLTLSAEELEIMECWVANNYAEN